MNVCLNLVVEGPLKLALLVLYELPEHGRIIVYCWMLEESRVGLDEQEKVSLRSESRRGGLAEDGTESRLTHTRSSTVHGTLNANKDLGINRTSYQGLIKQERFLALVDSHQFHYT